MAGSKHGRSGGSGGSGEVSPLASQLQQAWLQTQMPKVPKRSFTSSVINQSTRPSRMSGGAEPARPSALSALKSLSSLFPELADVQEEKKAMIFSVFEEGEQLVPLDPLLKEKKAQCLNAMFGENIVQKKLPQLKTQAQRSLSASVVPQSSDSSEFSDFRHRSLSASVVYQSSDSSEYSDYGHLSTSYSFSGSSHQTTPETPDEEFSYPSFDSGPSGTPSYLDTEAAAEVEVQQEKAPMFSYISEMLMDEKVEEKKCMFVEMSAYQAMAKELGDLISDDTEVSYDSNPPSDDSLSAPYGGALSALSADNITNPEYHVEDDVNLVDSWIDEILSGPVPGELRDSPGSKTKHDYGSDGFCSHTDPQSCANAHWNEEKDRDSGAAECQNSFLYGNSSLSGVNSENFAFGREDGSGRSLLVAPPVAPSSTNRGQHVPPVDLTNLLIRCAQAVEQSDFGHANELINELRQHSSAYGNGSQRMAHYFMEALVARMSGTGGQLYSALSNNRPSEAQMLRAQMLYCEHCPFIQVPHIFANHSILEAFKDASRVHIVDYGILYGVQWPCLLYQLSQRPGGPPHLRITGIDRPQPGFRPSARIQDTGRRLARLAKELGVPFEFHAIAEKWEAITPSHLFLREDEVLAVNCMFRFRHLLDESVTAASPRNLVLSRIKSLNPKIFVQGVFNAGYNAPFFMSRFREALSHFSTIFDAMESSFPVENSDRQIIDHEIVGREILNIVACEGLERVERSETYRQWQARTMRAGFQQKATSPETWAKIRTAMKSYHRDYGVGEDGSWFLLGWKDHITLAMTVWEPASDSP